MVHENQEYRDRMFEELLSYKIKLEELIAENQNLFLQTLSPASVAA